MAENEDHCCCGSPRLIFACSGASDVGTIADQAARRLSITKVASMGCLAAINSQLGFVIDSLSVASKIVAIDGCSEGCAKLTLEKVGVTDFHQLLLSDMGMEKGHSKVDQTNIARVYKQVQIILDN